MTSCEINSGDRRRVNEAHVRHSMPCSGLDCLICAGSTKGAWHCIYVYIVIIWHISSHGTGCIWNPQDGYHSTKGPMWGYSRCGLGAVGAVLEPFCGHLSPKLDKVSCKLTFEIPPRRTLGGYGTYVPYDDMCHMIITCHMMITILRVPDAPGAM